MLLHERAFQVFGNSNLHSPTSSLYQGKHPQVSHMLLIRDCLEFSDHSGYLSSKCSRFWCPELTTLQIWLNNIDMSETISSFVLGTVFLWMQSKGISSGSQITSLAHHLQSPIPLHREPILSLRAHTCPWPQEPHTRPLWLRDRSIRCLVLLLVKFDVH